jgi:hypothetical protein
MTTEFCFHSWPKACAGCGSDREETLREYNYTWTLSRIDRIITQPAARKAGIKHTHKGISYPINAFLCLKCKEKSYFSAQGKRIDSMFLTLVLAIIVIIFAVSGVIPPDEPSVPVFQWSKTGLILLVALVSIAVLNLRAYSTWRNARFLVEHPFGLFVGPTNTGQIVMTHWKYYELFRKAKPSADCKRDNEFVGMKPGGQFFMNEFPRMVYVLFLLFVLFAWGFAPG